MSSHRKWAALAFALALGGGGPALAAEGLHLSLGIGTALPAMSGDAIHQIKPEPASAEQVEVGYGFTDHIYAGLYASGAAGNASEDWDRNAVWDSIMLGLLGRYAFLSKGNVSPYLEIGVHEAAFGTAGDHHTFISDAAVGVLGGGGVDFFFGPQRRLLFGVDLSYRSARYTRARVKLDYNDPKIDGTYDVNFHANGDMVLLLFKVGYVWRPAQRPGF